MSTTTHFLMKGLRGEKMHLLKKSLAILVLPLGLAACAGDDSHMSDSELASRISSDDIPATVEQGIQVLDELLSDEIIRKLVLCDRQPREDSCREFIINFRLPLMRHISNEWIRPSDSVLRSQMNQDGLTDPEVMVARIMRLYVQSHETTID